MVFLTIVLIPLHMLDAADESKPGLLTWQDVHGEQALKPLQAAIPPHFWLADERLLLRTNIAGRFVAISDGTQLLWSDAPVFAAKLQEATPPRR